MLGKSGVPLIRAAAAGAVIAVTVGMGATVVPEVTGAGQYGLTHAQMRQLQAQVALLAESNTQIVGVPEWLTSAFGGGGGVFTPADSDAIYDTLTKQDPNPLIGWGTGGVQLDPQWNTWYNLPIDLNNLPSGTEWLGVLGGVTDRSQDQYYVPAGSEQVGTRTDLVPNPEYDVLWGQARDAAAKAGAEEVAKQQTLTVAVPYEFDNPLWTNFGNLCTADLCGAKKITGTENVSIDNPYYGVAADDPDLQEFLAGTKPYQGDVTVNVPFKTDKIVIRPKKWPLPEIAIPAINESFSFKQDYEFNGSSLVETDWDAQADQTMATDHANVPKQVWDDQIPVYNEEGYWTTTTSGQWVSPTDYFQRLQPMLEGGSIDLDGLSSQDMFYFANILGLTSVADLQDADASSIDWNKLAMLAPVLNWTTYIQNVNLIGYGDGNIAIGDAYRRFVQDINNGTITAGPAQTDGRYLTVLKDEDGNPIVRAVGEKEGEIWDYPLPNDASIKWPVPTVDKDGVVVSETPGGVIDFTLVTLGLLRNPGRPNGGLYSRFAPIYEGVTGVNPVTPERADNLPEGVDPALVTKLLTGNTDGLDFNIDNVGDLLTLMNNANGEKMLVTIKADATWAYDLLSDAPVTANPVAWANSAMSSLFLVNMANELLGASGKRSSEVGLEFYAVPDGQPDAGTFYATLTTGGLPLLAPLRLPANLIGSVTGEKVQTPFADTIEPLARILTNIGYTDVVTPEALASGKYDDEIYDGKTFVPYERTYREMHNPILFGTQTLNQSEIAHLQGDLIAAVGQGLDNGWDASVQAAAYRLVDVLGGNPSDIAPVVEAPGNAIRTVGEKVGAVVSDALVGLNGVLPQVIKTDDPKEQKLLADIYKPLGQGLKPLKQGADALNAGVVQLDSTLTGGTITAAADKLQSNPIGSLMDAGGDLQKAGADLQKRGTKLQSSLAKAQKDADDVVESVKSGNPKDIGNTVKAKVDKRVDRAKKDLDNGVAKVKETVKKVKDAVKKVTKTGE